MEAIKTLIWQQYTINCVFQSYIDPIYESITVQAAITLIGSKKNPYLEAVFHILSSPAIYSSHNQKYLSSDCHYLKWKQEKPLFGSSVPYFEFSSEIYLLLTAITLTGSKKIPYLEALCHILCSSAIYSLYSEICC